MFNQNPFLANQADPKDWDALDEFDDEEENEEAIDIGMCFCGVYGRAGDTHYRTFEGQLEECGEYL